ncbi:hypothetical protein BC828DRAFT_399349 [Blastocladiella britannica]|nr:hypothetical protein BC828DRAFT_399349 [Blastocladiella britannica]
MASLVSYSSDSGSDSDSPPPSSVLSKNDIPSSSLKRPTRADLSTSAFLSGLPAPGANKRRRLDAEDLRLVAPPPSAPSALSPPTGPGSGPARNAAGSGLFSRLPQPSSSSSSSSSKAPMSSTLAPTAAAKPAKKTVVRRVATTTTTPLATTEPSPAPPPTALKARIPNATAASLFSFDDDDGPGAAAIGPAVDGSDAAGMPPPPTADSFHPSHLYAPQPAGSSASYASASAAAAAAGYSMTTEDGAPDMDQIARELGVDRRDLHKLGLSEKQLLRASNASSSSSGAGPIIHQISVQDELQHEDYEQLAAAHKAAAPKAINQHLSASTKLGLLQLAKKAAAQSRELEGMFSANRQKKKAAGSKYGF